MAGALEGFFDFAKALLEFLVFALEAFVLAEQLVRRLSHWKEGRVRRMGEGVDQVNAGGAGGVNCWLGEGESRIQYGEARVGMTARLFEI